jgi:outer membrane lipoprotein-sorting protein
MTRKVFFTASLLLMFAGAFAQQSQKAFIKKVVNKYKAAKSISYTADYKSTSYSEEDTVSLKRNWRFVRNEKDTLFGGYFWHDV